MKLKFLYTLSWLNTGIKIKLSTDCQIEEFLNSSEIRVIYKQLLVPVLFLNSRN